MKARHTELIAIVFVMAATTIVSGQEINWMPIRSAPLGSPVGTVGDSISASFNGTCWEYRVSAGGIEVDLDLQAQGWGNAAGSPTLGAVQATVVSAGYINGVGGVRGEKDLLRLIVFECLLRRATTVPSHTTDNCHYGIGISEQRSDSIKQIRQRVAVFCEDDHLATVTCGIEHFRRVLQDLRQLIPLAVDTARSDIERGLFELGQDLDLDL